MTVGHAQTDSSMVEQPCLSCGAGVGVLSRPDQYVERFCPGCKGNEGNIAAATGVPAIFACGLDKFSIVEPVDTRVVNALRGLLVSGDPPREPDKPFVGIVGANGRGKSRALAGWIVEAKRRHRRPALFRTWTRIHLEILDSYKDGAEKRTIQVIDTYARVPFLAIDDLGADTDTEHSVGRLFDILNERLNSNLPTAFSCNYTLNQLKDRLCRKTGDDMQARRVLDRIAGSCVLVETWGSSRRGRREVA